MMAVREGSSPIVGLDVGTHRIGVAISDELQIIASPAMTIEVAQTSVGQRDAIRAIAAFAREHGVRRIVAGLPRNMKGERGVQAQWTEKFIAALRDELSDDRIFVVSYDERLTTVQAEQSLIAEGSSKRKRGTDPQGRRSRDARAAALILQGYLDRRRQNQDRRLDGADRDT